MDKHDIYIKIENEIQKNKDGLTELGRELFNHPEPGFKEVESNKILTSFCVRMEFPAAPISV